MASAELPVTGVVDSLLGEVVGIADGLIEGLAVGKVGEDGGREGIATAVGVGGIVAGGAPAAEHSAIVEKVDEMVAIGDAFEEDGGGAELVQGADSGLAFVPVGDGEIGEEGSFGTVGGNEGSEGEELFLVGFGDFGGEHGLPFVVDEDGVDDEVLGLVVGEAGGEGVDEVGRAEETGFDGRGGIIREDSG